MEITMVQGEESESNKEVIQNLTKTLANVTKTLASISSQINKLVDYFTSSDDSENNSGIRGCLRTMQSTLENINTQHTQPNSTIEARASYIKQSMTQGWNRSIDYRKKHFWQYIRNKNTAETYDRFYNSTPVILPRKFQIKKITGETEDQLKRRETLALNTFQTEIEQMKSKAQSHLIKSQQADEEMFARISAKSNGEVFPFIKAMWEDETKQQEDISFKLWERKNKTFLDTYERDFPSIHEGKNPYVRIEEGTIENRSRQPPQQRRRLPRDNYTPRPRSYAEIASGANYPDRSIGTNSIRNEEYNMHNERPAWQYQHGITYIGQQAQGRFQSRNRDNTGQDRRQNIPKRTQHFQNPESNIRHLQRRDNNIPTQNRGNNRRDNFRENNTAGQGRNNDKQINPNFYF